MLTIHVIGMGPGNPDLLTGRARKALAEATIVVGDTRLLRDEVKKGKTVVQTYKADEIRDIAAHADRKKDCLAVLVSGDVGFFSLSKFIRHFPDCRIIRHPGISSLVYFAAALETDWEDARIVSRHGCRTGLVEPVMTHKKVFCLTGGTHNSVCDLCRELSDNGLGSVRIVVGENLSYKDERITEGTAQELKNRHFDPLAVMMIFNDRARLLVKGVHGWEDGLFIRDRVPMTKQEVRALVISKLRPRADDIVYDIGAGTGACSVELAFQVPLGRVYAFEINETAVSLAEANKERFRADNLEIIKGDAAETIVPAEAPDCVFIGGTKGKLETVLDILYDKNAGCRVVITAITLETAGAVTSYYKDKRDYDLNTVLLFAAADKKVGPYTLMEGHNPVYIMTALPREL